MLLHGGQMGVHLPNAGLNFFLQARLASTNREGTMGDKITFNARDANGNPLRDAKGNPINPTFIGLGSKIEHPDVLPIFLGSWWTPGSGALTVENIMNALKTLASGPYFDGLKQYGYVGPVQVRNAQVDSQPWIASNNSDWAGPGPNVNQVEVLNTLVWKYIHDLVDNDEIDNVDDNHDLIVVVFLDPNNPQPQNFDNAGNVIPGAGGGALGANYKFEDPNTLDDATRFQYAWITTSNGFVGAMRTLSHELAESITDPFKSGWEQNTPAPSPPNDDQISDVCNQPAISGGIPVTAYWSNADIACIVPTPGVRRVSLSQTLTKHEAHDEPQKTGYVNFGKLCGDGYFDYFERTFANSMNVQADIQGYEQPILTWQINGQPVPLVQTLATIPISQATVDVPARWEPEPGISKVIPGPIKPATATLVIIGGAFSIGGYSFGPGSNAITIGVGPNAGNCSFTITLSVSESFDNGAGSGSSTRTGSVDVTLENQHIIWGKAYQDAKKNCQRLIQQLEKSDDRQEVIGPPHPGDPPNLLNIIQRALDDHSANRAEGLRNAAQLVQAVLPELAQNLLILADRTA
jgi:hypothetical protein